MIREWIGVVERRIQGVCGERKVGKSRNWGLADGVLGEAREARWGVKRDVCTIGLTEEGDEALQALKKCHVCVCVAIGREGFQVFRPQGPLLKVV